MRLLYTLRYGSVAGNCGGDLRLFFTTQNAADWKPSPPVPPPAPGMWQGTNVAETLTLPTGDAIGITLDLLNNGQAGLLYLFGTITITPKGGAILGNMPIGQATVNFMPGAPAVSVWKGRKQGTTNGITWDAGFDLAVPWDGMSADCNGQWWALWH